MQAIQPTLEEIQASVSKAGLMMIDVNRRISQWDQQRIMNAVELGSGKTPIISGQRPSKVAREVSMADEEAPRSSTHRPSTQRSSTLPGTAGAESGKASDGPSLGVPDQGQLHHLM